MVVDSTPVFEATSIDVEEDVKDVALFWQVSLHHPDRTNREVTRRLVQDQAIVSIRVAVAIRVAEIP